jgi:DNA-binding transcriptional ArsR family regulator
VNLCQRVQMILVREEMTRGELVAASKLSPKQVDQALYRLQRDGIVVRNGVHPVSTYAAKVKTIIEEKRGSAPASLENLKLSQKRGHPEYKKRIKLSTFRHPLDIAWAARVFPIASGGE